MKTVIKDDKIVVFLNKNNIFDLDFNDEKKLKEYFKKLFSQLKKNYNYEVSGYFNIDVYKDKNYGMILEIENEQLDYYSYFNQIDMKINIYKDSLFLYEIGYNFLNADIIKNVICYRYIDKIYLEIKKEINDIIFAKILEYSDIIYGDEVQDIKKNSKRVKI